MVNNIERIYNHMREWKEEERSVIKFDISIVTQQTEWIHTSKPDSALVSQVSCSNTSVALYIGLCGSRCLDKSKFI